MRVQSKLPVIPRQPAVEALQSILRLDSPERVLNIVGEEGGEGKTWALLGLMNHCQERELAHNQRLIDFYDTTHQRLSGVLTSIVSSLDPKGKSFGPYLEKRREFDALRAKGFGGQTLSPISEAMDHAFLECLRAFGRARRRDGQRGVALFFDTWEVARAGRVSRWLLTDFLGASEDIAVVVAGRPPIPDERTRAPILRYAPGPFNLGEIEVYIDAILQHYGVLDPMAKQRLASHVLAISGGVPVLVTLALDIVQLGIMPHAGAHKLDEDMLLRELMELTEESAEPSLLERLEPHARRDSTEQKMVASLLDLLRETPAQQWALLFMAHFRRRFNKDIYNYLQGQPMGGTHLLETFRDFYVVKYRELGGAYGHPPREPVEVSTLLHDRIRENVQRRYWQGAIPTLMVMSGRNAEIFHPKLDALWAPFCDPDLDLPEIPATELKPILDWLDNCIVAYYEHRRAELKQRQEYAKDDAEHQVELLYRQQALMAEQLLYELDRDLEGGWRHWCRVYYEAFEAYQQGYCEQLELTVLNAWTEEEVKKDPRKQEIQELVHLRRAWWDIKHSSDSRRRAIQGLERIVRERGPASSELLADAYAALGWAYSVQGDTRLAMRHRFQAAEIYRELGLEWSLAGVLDFLGESYDRLGQFAHADDAWREANELAVDLNDHYRLASVAMKQGYSLNVRGESSRALGRAKVAEVLFRSLGDRRSLGLALNYQGRIYQAAGRFEHAQRVLADSQRYSEQFGGTADQVRLDLSWGEFYRRRAQSKMAKEGDFQRAQDLLDRALEVAKAYNYGNWQARALEEMGCLYRDEAKQAMLAEDLDRAGQFWEQARVRLTEALMQHREQEAIFQTADLLDDLCELHEDQYYATGEGQSSLEARLDELYEISSSYGFDRYLSRAAEVRARLEWSDGRFEEAIQHYVDACKHAGLRTRAGTGFRTAYDRLVGELEEKLGGLGSEQMVSLAQLALRLWGRTGQVATHPQFTQACQRVLYPAQSRLDEEAADDSFDKGRLAYEEGEREQAEGFFAEAFRLYVQACDHIGRLTDASYENYLQYAGLVGKLERRFYDLPDMALASDFSQFVESEWQRLEQTVRHPAVLEVCQRVGRMAELARVPTGDVQPSSRDPYTNAP